MTSYPDKRNQITVYISRSKYGFDIKATEVDDLGDDLFIRHHTLETDLTWNEAQSYAKYWSDYYLCSPYTYVKDN